MGDETRQITNKLETTIMGIYDKVGDIAITQATICTKQDAMHRDVKRINGRLGAVEKKTDKLESWRDKFIGGGKVVGGLVVLVGIIFGALKVFL